MIGLENEFRDAVANYRKKADGCVALANDIISSHAEIEISLRFYNLRIASFKSAIMRMTNNMPEKTELLNELFCLEKSALDLDVSVDEAMLMALRKLSLRFERVREASLVVRELMHDSFEGFMPVLIESQQDIDDVCTRLATCCAIEHDVLGGLGIDSN